MTAPLTLRTLVPIYALSGSPHPDTPPTATGKAVAVEAETPALPRAGPRRRLPPSRRRFRFSPDLHDAGTNSFRFPL